MLLNLFFLQLGGFVRSSCCICLRCQSQSVKLEACVSLCLILTPYGLICPDNANKQILGMERLI